MLLQVHIARNGDWSVTVRKYISVESLNFSPHSSAGAGR